MKEQVFMRLQSSEGTIATIAARIFSAYIIAGEITDQNEGEMLNKAVVLAAQLAKKVDNLVESDEERDADEDGIVV